MKLLPLDPPIEEHVGALLLTDGELWDLRSILWEFHNAEANSERRKFATRLHSLLIKV